MQDCIYSVCCLFPVVRQGEGTDGQRHVEPQSGWYSGRCDNAGPGPIGFKSTAAHRPRLNHFPRCSHNPIRRTSKAGSFNQYSRYQAHVGARPGYEETRGMATLNQCFATFNTCRHTKVHFTLTTHKADSAMLYACMNYSLRFVVFYLYIIAVHKRNKLTS